MIGVIFDVLLYSFLVRKDVFMHQQLDLFVSYGKLRGGGHSHHGVTGDSDLGVGEPLWCAADLDRNYKKKSEYSRFFLKRFDALLDRL